MHAFARPVLVCALITGVISGDEVKRGKQGQGIFRRLTPLRSRWYPLNNVVRLSNGCSGTLITTLHVLTSASCVQNTAPGTLKLLIPDPMGGSMVYPRSIRIPNEYTDARTPLEAAQNNVAVLTLRSKVMRSKFIPMMAVDGTTLKLLKVVHYGGYVQAGDRQAVIGVMSCPVQQSLTTIKVGLLFTHCSLPDQMGGSALVVKHPATNERIIGVMSRRLNGEWNIGVPFMEEIVDRICSWLGQTGQKDGVCVQPQSALALMMEGN